MDLPSSSYLYSLAVVSTTYVGFSALLVGLRQAKGSRLTKNDAYFTLTFIQVGFIVTVSGLIPSLVALYGGSLQTVWRIASLAAAVPILWFAASLPARRRAATGMPIPGFVKVIVVVQVVAGLSLLLNAVFSSRAQAGAIYSTAVTLVLVSSGLAYLLALKRLRPDVDDERQ